MTLSTYLRHFSFSRTSMTYLGEPAILAGQHNYHPEKAPLVIASHLLQWRFYAGLLTRPFLAIGWKWLRAALVTQYQM